MKIRIDNRLIILIFSITVCIKLNAQSINIDSIKVYAVEFNSVHSLKLQDVLLKNEAVEILLKDSILCNIINQIFVLNIGSFEISKELKNYSADLLDLRLLIELFSNGNCSRIGISPSGKLFLNGKEYL